MTTTPSFTRMASQSASTKRKAAINVVTGLAGSPAVSLASIMCIPLHPADSATELRVTLNIDALTDLLQTFTQGDLDIITGDILVVGGKEYPIRHVQSWPFARMDTRLLLVVEALKN